MINKVRSTHKELTSTYSRLTTKALGFTMAEILLSLTIIGVVAAITLPSLTGNINERTWNTQRKALYSRFSQAIALMPALNGYGTLDDTDSKNVAETFITNGLAKVLKINNICGHGADGSSLQECGFPATFTTLNASKKSLNSITTLVGLNNLFNDSISFTNGASMSYTQIDTKAAAFETANGESILAYYNPRCVGNPHKNSYYLQPTMCANFIYDLNGKKGPNTVGKDIGVITAFYPTDSIVVAPMLPHTHAVYKDNYSEAIKYCKQQDEDNRVPNIDELSSMFVNRKLFTTFPTSNWSSTKVGNNIWTVAMFSGMRVLYPPEMWSSLELYCVKRY